MRNMDLLYRIMVGLQTFLAWLLTPIFRLRARRVQRTMPKITNNILRYSATALAEKIRNKELLCTEIIQAYINRIQEVNPLVNAVVEERFSDALNDADKIDKIIANNELNQDYIARRYPLLGVPVTVKETCSLEGLSYCVGTKRRIGLKADADGEAVRKIRDAGAIPLLVSNTPEMCCGWETSNLVTGRTLNPYNLGCTSGGSSGGEGALLGSGSSVIGIGSDLAGSIRLPAMFNGVFGHKPTPKTVSINGHYPICPDKRFLEFFTIGPMTRYAEDLKLMLSIMSENPESLNLNEKVDVNRLNIFFMYEAEKSCVQPSVNQEIKAAIDKCVEYLKDNYKTTTNDYKFDMKNTCEMSATIFYKMADIPNVLQDPLNRKKTKNLYLEVLKSVFGQSDCSLHGLFFYFLQKHNIFVPRSKYEHYLEKAESLKNDFCDKLGNNGVFLYPTFPTLPFEHDKILLLAAGVMYGMIFNILGLPSTNVPVGRSKNGLPIGIQVVGAPYQDRLCLAAAQELEKCFGGWCEP